MLVRKRRRPKAVKSRGEGKTKSKGWIPGQKDHGGEGLSHGHGGSAGEGKATSSPEKHPKTHDEPGTDAVADKARRNGDYSPALPSRERIAKVLR